MQVYEDFTVPAGTFTAWRLVYQGSFSERQTLWFAPGTMGIFVKRLYERPASFPQGRAVTPRARIGACVFRNLNDSTA